MAVFAFLSLAALLAAHPLDPPTGNPVLPVSAADPHLALLGDRYFLYATGAGKEGNGFAAWSSPDLRHWTKAGMALRFSDVAWAKEADWAPAIAARNGRYYLYFCADSQIGVATGERPEGPFRDALGRPLVPFRADLSSIDPMVFTDDDGKAYLYWGAGPASWLRGKVGPISDHLYVRPLAPDMISFAGPERATITSPEMHIEGSFVFKRRGRYYLMWSSGSWGATGGPHAYQLHYATAAAPLGPWTPAPTPVLTGDAALKVLAPGHNSVLELPGRDEVYVAYHTHDGDKERFTWIDRLTFDDRGAIQPVRPTREGPPPRPVPLSVGLERVGPFSRRDGVPVVVKADKGHRIEVMADGKRIGPVDARAGEARLLWAHPAPGAHRIGARGVGAQAGLRAGEIVIDVN